ncbi:hypothetical protein [Sorangium sp. So ce1099]|uniref:hypothetical protein n=1 Tax=Sorangium sp. So ce1099 TaxID=3133331 RepID=UPI003F5FFC53
MKTSIVTWAARLAIVGSAAALGACGRAEGDGGGGVGGGGGEGDSGGEGGGAALECADYLDESPVGSASFVVKNNRAESIYLGSAQCSSRLSVKAPGLTSTQADSPQFGFTCGEAQESPDYALDCLDESAEEIAPGAQVTLTWGGSIYEERELPRACYHPERRLGGYCLQGVAPEAGDLEVTVTLYASAECTDDYCMRPTGYFNVSKRFAFPGEEVLIEVEP